MRTNTRLSTNQPASTSVSTANFAQKNCPNKILVKANEEIPAVHVDYGKGKKLYKFDCAKYGEICPTGAIIKQDGKSPILNTQKCIGCGACKSMCWHGIIEIFSVKEQKTI
ncbi:MAG: ATP-binding protein [Candidatus Gastranaerophilaceae bacterium]